MSSNQDDCSPLTMEGQSLFAQLNIGGVVLSNRLAVAPMTRVSATAQGIATPRMGDYYSRFAQGGFGLVITEGIYTDTEFSQGYLFQPGLVNSEQCEEWSAIVAGVKAHGSYIFAQLMHAGALSQGNPHRIGTRGPSALRPKGQQMSFYRGLGDYAIPQAMNVHDITDVVAGFVQAAVRAQQAGFDGIEIHGANGYLLDQFLSEGINLRNDCYGGSVKARLRLVTEVVKAVRDAVGSVFVVGVRISQAKVNDYMHKWRGGENEAAEIFGLLGELPINYLHTTEFEAWQPAFDAGLSLTALAKKYGAVPVLANGSLHEPTRAAGLIERGEADFISLGRGALTHPDWPRRVERRASLEAFDPASLSPIADLEHADQHRTAKTRASI